jgi:hypothetical protein
MTDQTPPTPPPRSRPTAGRPRPRLYRTVLGLALAAIVAAWLPFSMFYVAALDKRATTVTAITAPHASAGTPRVVTTASGATRLVSTGTGATVAHSAPTPVVTRTS